MQIKIKGSAIKAGRRNNLLTLCLFFTAITALFLPASAMAKDDAEILIGLIPEENIFRLVERHKPLEAYLSEKLGIKVRFTILSKYGDIIDRFVSRNMDGAFFGVFTATLAYEKLEAEPLARPINLDGSTTVEGYIFVRKDSGITSVKGMKGKKVAFVDRASATGYLFIYAFLRENGITNIDKYFSEQLFTGSHDSTVYAVLDGRADIGVTKSRIFNKITAKDPLIKDELFIIARSMPMPDRTLSLRKDINPLIRKKINDVLLHMHEDAKGKEVLKKLEALKFVEAGTADFRDVMRLINNAGINLKTYKYR